MKQFKYILSILLVVTSFWVHAQEKYDSWIITDRDVYTSGETSLVKIYVPQEQKFQMLCLSLSSSNGKSVTNIKLGIDDHQASGGIYLPDSLSSGSYLLTAYSCHVEKQAFVSKEIIVINRFENQDQDIVFNRGDFDEIDLEESKNIKAPNLKSSYKRRDDVNLQLAVDESLLSELEGNFSVSVSRKMPGINSQYVKLNPDYEKTNLLTEKKGVVLQGKVTNKSTGEPESGALVYLTIPDSIPYFDYYTTDLDGHFYFMMEELYGSQSIYIEAVKDSLNDDLKVSLEENLTNDKLVFTPNQVVLTDTQKEYLSETILLSTFNKVYEQSEYKYLDTPYEPDYSFPFYGQAEYVVDPDEYVDLPDFVEISRELLSPVKFRDRKDGYSLQVFDRDLEDYFEEDPLILIDGVPIQSLSRLSSLGTEEIDWIEVVPRLRFYGNQRFMGVLAIYTKAGDASLIYSSDRILKLDYSTLQEEILIESPDLADEHSPDFRQVLYWNSNLKAKEGINVSFTTSDVKGRYEILVSARKKDGELVQFSRSFTVNE